MAKSAKPTAARPATKGEILNALAERTGMKRKQVADVLTQVTSLIVGQLKHSPSTVTLPGLIKFKVAQRPATPEKMGVNPFTKEPMLIKAKPARKVVKALPVKALKDMI